MSIVDHIGLQVSDLDRAIAFYMAALKPLDVTLLVQYPAGPDGPASAGFGRNGKPELWISSGRKISPRVHIAIVAGDRAAVAGFHKAAVAAGGEDNGAPGIRAHNHADYYAAFVLDPDGHNIEAVCHKSA